MKVVLADDEALIRLDIREMLTEVGHEVAGEANNGEDAVAMTRALHPDLVIMDVLTVSGIRITGKRKYGV